MKVITAVEPIYVHGESTAFLAGGITNPKWQDELIELLSLKWHFV